MGLFCSPPTLHATLSLGFFAPTTISITSPSSCPTMARMNRPAPVEVCYKNMRFLITHNPTNATLNTFLEDLKKYGATTVVRVCEVTYDKTPPGEGRHHCHGLAI